LVISAPAAERGYEPDASRRAAVPRPDVTRDVVGFWHGRLLSYLRRMCLASQVKQGYRVTLFSYDPIGDLPDGVTNADAEAIIPLAFKRKLERVATRADIGHRATIQLSDFFRVRLQKMGLGVWLDNDLYLLRPMTIVADTPYFAWESLFRIGNAVMYLPPAHPIIDFYERLMEQNELIPEWIARRHWLTLQFWKRSGKGFNPSDLKLALFGPATLTTLAKQTGAAKFALPRRSFYAIHADHKSFFAPSRFQSLVEDPKVIGIHVSPKRLEDAIPAPGTLYEWMAGNADMLQPH
jgi:hypothetical protein